MQKLGGLQNQEPMAFDLAAIKETLTSFDFRPSCATNEITPGWLEFTKSNLPRLDTDPRLQAIIDRHLAIRGLDQVVTYSEEQASALLASPVTGLDCLFSAGELQQIPQKDGGCGFRARKFSAASVRHSDSSQSLPVLGVADWV